MSCGLDLDQHPTGREPDSVTATASIALMFGGIASWRSAPWWVGGCPGWAAGRPVLVLATGLITAAFYSIERMVHFVLLGLLWGAAWLLLAYVAHREATKPIISGNPAGSAAVTVDDNDETLTSNTSRAR